MDTFTFAPHVCPVGLAIRHSDSFTVILLLLSFAQLVYLGYYAFRRRLTRRLTETLNVFTAGRNYSRYLLEASQFLQHWISVRGAGPRRAVTVEILEAYSAPRVLRAASNNLTPLPAQSKLA